MKSELYKSTEFCMSFSAEEVQRDYINPLAEIVNATIQVDYDGPNGSIDYICIESETSNLSVRFYGFETALFMFDEKIMLIDDIQKTKYTLDHTYGNVVYDGTLRNLTHADILKLLLDLTECFIDCTSVAVEVDEIIPPTVDTVGKNNYKILVSGKNPATSHRTFSNISVVFWDQSDSHEKN